MVGWPSGRRDIDRARNEEKEAAIERSGGKAFSVEGTAGAKDLRLEGKG